MGGFINSAVKRMAKWKGKERTKLATGEFHISEHNGSKKAKLALSA